MTITNETTKVTVLGNGAQTTFNYGFLIPRAGECALWYVDLDGVATLVDPTDYTVTGIGNSNGGTFSYSPAIASGASLTLVREVPPTQTANLVNQGAYYPQTLENGGLDRIVMQIQQLYTLMGLTVRAPIVDAALDELPPEALREGWLYFGVDGQPTVTTIAPPSSISALEITGGQSILAEPVGNPVDTYSSLVASGTTAYADQREFLASFGFISNLGSGASSPERDKVTLYAGMLADDGTGDAWTLNTVTSLFPGASAYSAFGYELDYNNLNGHRGDTPGGAGLAAPVGYGLAISGFATYRSTAALILTAGVADTWNRGLVVTAGTVQASFQDVGLAERSLDIRSANDIGLSLEAGAFARAPILIGNGAKIAWRNAADSADLGLAYLDGSNNFQLGANAVASVVLGGTASVLPATNNTTSLGNGTYRFSEVYAVNGTINTSDLRAKNSVKKMPSMLDVVREIEPITFKFNTGGADTVKVMEQELLPVYETVKVERERTVVRNGAAVVEKYAATEQRKVMDSVPVLGPYGKQEIVWTKPVLGKNGRVIAPAMPVGKTHLVPRMAMQPVEKTVVQPRPGVRTHYGFAAEAFKETFDKLGLGDFGGYVVDGAGTEGLRDNQIVAVLWRAVRDLDAQVQALRGD